MWPSPFHRKKSEPKFTHSPEATPENRPVSSSLSKNLSVLTTVFSNCSDLICRELRIGQEEIPAYLIFISGMTNEQALNQNVLTPIMNMRFEIQDVLSLNKIELLKNVFLEIGNIKEMFNIREVVKAILNGSAVLLLDRVERALEIDIQGFESRTVAEPVSEGVVRGPREGFTETLRTNTVLLRRKIKSPHLKLEKFILGQATNTEVNIAYLEGTVNSKTVGEVRKRISRIKVDSILESAYIEELIEDAPFSLFPQIEHSERPDKVAAAILAGRIAIFTDGTPFVLMLPTTFFMFLQSNEDYYERYFYSTLIRLVRVIFLNFALLLPGIYIAITTYHRELLPTALLTSITAAREGVPFPTVIEVLIMEITFEALREAGVRLPRPVGQAVSIVGALVIGDAAVKANIVSSATVIIVALTGISSFILPAYNFALSIRILRFIMILLGSTLGMYGILLGLLVMQAHLVSLRSFGVPYFAPLAPFNLKDAQDLVIRAPWWAMGERPRLLGNNNRRRQKFFLKPAPPDKDRQ